MSQWFVIQNEKVFGPYTDMEVRKQVADGQLQPNHLIWGRSQPEWKNISWWMKDPSVTQMPSKKPETEQLWHYSIGGDSRGPFKRVELINEIKAIRQNSEILIWTKGMKAWADLYEFHDLLEELGMNRREHPRAFIHGSVVVTTEKTKIIGVLKTISPGGLGAIQLNSKLSIGQSVTVEIKSDALRENIVAKATIQYTSDMGFYGFKFAHINMEAKSLIMDYIRDQKTTSALAA